MKYPNLFEPIKIGSAVFKNRIISAPTGHPDVTPDNNFTEDAITYYERKAQGGAAAISLGEAIVDSVYGKRHPRQVSLDAPGSFFNLSRLADSVVRHGTILSMELQHSGMNTTPGIVTPNFCTASDIVYGPVDCEINGVKIKQMPEEIIYEIIEKFAVAAKRVQNCGFGMVTVHAGHGWLLNQFMTPRVNTRTDKWGGSAENRSRFAVEVCDAIHNLCGADFPVEIRISASEASPEGYGIDEGIKMAMALDGHADIIHASCGCDIGLPKKHSFSKTHPCMFKDDGVNVVYAEEIIKHVKKSKVATVGALTDPAMMEEILSSGKADFVEAARALICDPDLPNKARDGRDDEITHCMRCFSCFSNLKGHGGFFCAINPETSRERTFSRPMPPAKKQKVLIAGGGLGGMQAALTAANAGHEVILCEKNSRLGGNILCEEKVPFKKHLAEYIAQREQMIMKSSIDLRLNTEVTHDYAKSIGADVIIAAIGAMPIKPNIKGIDGKNVLGAEEVYINPGMVGNRVAILGAGLVGTELAIYLKSLGKEPLIIEMTDKFNPGSNDLHGQAVLIKLDQENIEIKYSTKAVEINDNGVDCETPEGKRSFEADTVIYAVGQKPLTDLALSLHDCAGRFHIIGDCVRPRNISAATLEGMSVALDIGRF